MSARLTFFMWMLVVVAPGAGATGQVQTAVLPVFPLGPQQNASLDIGFEGPRTGQVLNSRMHLEFATGPGFDAALLVAGVIAPLADSPGFGGWFVTGAELGWSGEGTFVADVSSNELNGGILSDMWGLRLSGLTDPAMFSGEFGAGCRIEVDYLDPTPPPCAGDFNQDQQLMVDDILAFLGAWFAQVGTSGPGLSADANGDEVVDMQDVFAFLQIWMAGC